MSARNMPGISAGGTRATSRTVMPSRTPIGISLVAVGDEARGQRPDVGDGFQVLELLGDARGVARRERALAAGEELGAQRLGGERLIVMTGGPARGRSQRAAVTEPHRSEEHTSELQSLAYLVCRLLLEKKKKRTRRKL